MPKKLLIIYYSQAVGNTKRMAEELAQATGGDLAAIETVTPYTGTYDEILEQGNQEVQAGYMPEIKPLSKNIKDYDIIAVGTPTWWYTMAPAVRTFLSSQDWTGKTVIPFQTHGGWPGHVIQDMKALCKGASFLHEMEIRFDSTGGSDLVTKDRQIENWLTDCKSALM